MRYPQSDIWDGVGRQALLPTMFQQRLWLTSMVENFSDHNSAQLVFGGNDESISVAGLEKGRLARAKLPIVAETWDIGFLMSGAPLISRHSPDVAFMGLLENAADQMGARAILFRKVGKSTDFENVLHRLSENQIAGFSYYNAHERASLDCQGDFEDWFTGNFSRKRRKEYRRLRSRLGEMGKLASQSWRVGEAIEPWIDEFLRLEAAGWKGRARTAIACNEKLTGHIRQALRQLAKEGSLLFWKITLDGKTIAILFGFADGEQAWLGKMAFDETLAKFSPGVLIILDATKSLFEHKTVKWADSCAAPNHPMIDNIWRDRLAVCDYLVAVPGTGKAGFATLAAYYNLRAQMRETLKTAYLKLKGG